MEATYADMQKYVRGVRISCFPPPHETCRAFTPTSSKVCKRASLQMDQIQRYGEECGQEAKCQAAVIPVNMCSL